MHISSFMQVKSVFVDGLPPHWDEDRVRDQFKGYGEIERVVLARNMATAKRKDFGFVDFTTHEDAIACIEGVNNTELGDGKTKVLSQPPSLYIFIYLNISFFLNSDSIYHILIVFNAVLLMWMHFMLTFKPLMFFFFFNIYKVWAVCISRTKF